MHYHYPVYIRLWHLLNALFFLALIMTGLSMQYSNPDSPFISFPLSVKLHNISGIGLTANYLIFFIGNIISGNGKHYREPLKNLDKKYYLQVKYYISGFFKREKPPYPVTEKNKFNPSQAISYAVAMYIGVPLLLITGWGLLFPETILSRVFGVSGLVLTDLLHVITGFLMSVFMFVHIYICTIGKNPFGNFRAIITGWSEAEEK